MKYQEELFNAWEFRGRSIGFLGNIIQQDFQKLLEDKIISKQGIINRKKLFIIEYEREIKSLNDLKNKTITFLYSIIKKK